MFTPPRLLLSIETLSADAEPARVDLCGFYSINNGEAGAIMRPMWLKPEYRRIFSSNYDFRPRRSSQRHANPHLGSQRGRNNGNGESVRSSWPWTWRWRVNMRFT